MILKMTNSAYGKLRISDVGEITTPKLTHGGIDLPYDTEVTLADDAKTAASMASGELAAAIAAGDVTVVDAAGAYAPRQLTQHAAATAGQTVFTITEGYTAGNDSLHVYVEGSLQPKPSSPAATYVETDTNTVTFSAGLTLDDDVQFIWSK